MHTADDVLIRESVREPDRFAPLFDRHAVAIHRYLARRIGAPADDLLAETFLIAFRRRAAYQPLGLEVRSWLFGIATNVLHRHVRQEERRYRALARAVAEQPRPHADDSAEDRVDAAALRSDLAAALARLKPGDRDALLLLAYAQLSYAEIAVALEIPVGTVRSRISRARKITRAALSLPAELSPLEEEK
ncbi:DNA-directed RNA polymerase sigma-70 factor [Actinoplanes italicus]|uniref:RNA polymerase sigma-70 factor (ECF subfamily) n=1 Tax=Actinoplanes italicus TaxID=113567 RepID=A0A2T0KNV9_9ACTN|nr:RNA polymerase sigma factor [Actinoplanes italicus]PRX25420.1 RNA polymerase sigma-70 factor (ECF subfamily) [Actinoplanes italicus]GIE29139.1 DNA-directed RNA polymerase sigma-70 factor [Actinoplanes italicus]